MKRRSFDLVRSAQCGSEVAALLLLPLYASKEEQEVTLISSESRSMESDAMSAMHCQIAVAAGEHSGCPQTLNSAFF